MLLFFSDLGVYFYHIVEFIALYFGKYTLKYFCFWSHKSSFNLFLNFLESLFNEHTTFALQTDVLNRKE